MARFDWYQASVPAEVPALREALLQGLGDHQPRWEPMQRAPHGFGAAARLIDFDGPRAMLWWGGMHARPHVVVSGEAAQPASQLLRAEFPEHFVSRVDVCTDYGDPGAYDRLQGLALAVAQERGIKVGTAGDHLLTKLGRTCYLGSTKSHTRMRLYDKSAELREKFAGQLAKLAEIPETLARLEFQVRPQTPAAKAAAAVADPVALMGSAAWTRELVQRVDGLSLEPFMAGRPWRQADDDRAYSALLAQYGGLLMRIRSDLGSAECLGLQICSDLVERAVLKRAKL